MPAPRVPAPMSVGAPIRLTTEWGRRTWRSPAGDAATLQSSADHAKSLPPTGRPATARPQSPLHAAWRRSRCCSRKRRMPSAPQPGRRATASTQRVHAMAGAHFDWSAVLAAGGSLSLFADRQLVEIRIPSGKAGQGGSAALQQIAANSAGQDDTLTLVLLPRLDAATQKSAWFGALDANGVTVRIDPVEARPATELDRAAPAATGPARRRRRGGAAHAGLHRRPGRATCSRRTRRSRSSACSTHRVN